MPRKSKKSKPYEGVNRVRAPKVPERLRDLGNIYEDRNKLYGDNYKHFGKVMQGMFPRGVHLATEEDWTRIGVFIQAVSKMTRYGQSFERKGHPDSLDDCSVYCQMLQEVDYDFFAVEKAS